MDQLFVNERLPSPSPPGSPRRVEDEGNPWRDDEPASISSKKEPPLPPLPTDEGETSYTQHRQDTLSALEGTEESSTQSWNQQDAGEGGTSILEQYPDAQASGNAGRPTLSSRRSTGQNSEHVRSPLLAGGLFDEGVDVRSYNSTPRRRSPSNFDTYGDGQAVEAPRNRSASTVQRRHDTAMDSHRPPAPRRYSRPARPYSYAGGSNINEPLPQPLPNPPLGLWAGQIGRESSPETVVPRWQPDAEVTFCPICKTQFSKPLMISLFES
jgi:hypothetical protein